MRSRQRLPASKSFACIKFHTRWRATTGYARIGRAQQILIERVEKPRRSRAFPQCAIDYYEVAVRSTFSPIPAVAAAGAEYSSQMPQAV